METKPITIEVETESAEAFAAVSATERKKVERMLSLYLRYLTARPCSSFREAVSQARQETAANGLTPEILESLLVVTEPKA